MSNHLRWGGRRPVHVYLPPGYDTDMTRRYPAVYVLYGLEMLKDGRLGAAIDRGSEQRSRRWSSSSSSPPAPTSTRARSGEAHIHMLESQVVPLVDGQFRTLAQPRQRVLLGADEGGFGAVEAVLRLPGVFGNAVAHSVFPLSKGGDELLALVDRTATPTERFYVDWGRYDPHPPRGSSRRAGIQQGAARPPRRARLPPRRPRMGRRLDAALLGRTIAGGPPHAVSRERRRRTLITHTAPFVPGRCLFATIRPPGFAPRPTLVSRS